MFKQVTRIMVLGVIAYREPISGYGIEKTFDEWAVARWGAIAPASIYQQLRSLVAAGFISPASEQSGRAVHYVCTPRGRTELHDLLLALLDEKSPQPLSLLPLLYFTPSLAQDELVAGISRRIALIDRALAYEGDVIDRANSAGPSHVTEFFRLTWHGLRADRAWCQEFLGRLGA